MACGGLKLTTSNYTAISESGSSTERDQYKFDFTKKAGDYLEIVEVKLLNPEKGMDESVPFQVTGIEGNKTLLDIKGQTEFSVVASKISGAEKTLATGAMIVYRTEKDGDKKYHSIKKIGQ